jgi:hypothetical protein
MESSPSGSSHVKTDFLPANSRIDKDGKHNENMYQGVAYVIKRTHLLIDFKLSPPPPPE